MVAPKSQNLLPPTDTTNIRYIRTHGLQKEPGDELNTWPTERVKRDHTGMSRRGGNALARTPTLWPHPIGRRSH